MSEDFKTSFLTYYIQSLGERTREEKKGTKFGFDWVIYNLALAEDWIPLRLPFLRAGGSTTSTTKSEPEFGIDFAFLSQDRSTLRIFVLKDEVLNNANWGAHSFDIDLRNASAPDLRTAEARDVTRVEVVLAYNKDEDRTGIELFDRRAAALGTRVGDQATLQFARWNLTTIVGRIQSSLLTPSLLPQKFFSHFSYLCSQYADFRHGSDEWARQMIPNWRRFLEDLLSENTDERCIRLLPVALLILQEHGKSNPTAETGWIDLIEWGMLAAWRVSQTATKQLKNAVWRIWIDFYVAELERYYEAHSDDLAVRFSVDKTLSGFFVDTIASAVLAHWHVARIGLLGLAYDECLPASEENEIDRRQLAVSTVANWLVGVLNANPSSMRPIIDLHHIELFLTWSTLLRAGRIKDIYSWLLMLMNSLACRRSGHAQIPFIEGGNSIALVFEYVVTGERPDEFCEGSSVYLTCLMELCGVLPHSQRDTLLELVYRRLVLGRDDDGVQMKGCGRIDLMSWVPPNDWSQHVLMKSLRDEGECDTVHFGKFGTEPTTGSDIASSLETLVAETRKKRAFAFPDEVPMSAMVLACLKHHSPLPPEFWRRIAYPELS
jgi:hypothetical protein